MKVLIILAFLFELIQASIYYVEYGSSEIAVRCYVKELFPKRKEKIELSFFCYQYSWNNTWQEVNYSDFSDKLKENLIKNFNKEQKGF